MNFIKQRTQQIQNGLKIKKMKDCKKFIRCESNGTQIFIWFTFQCLRPGDLTLDLLISKNRGQVLNGTTILKHLKVHGQMERLLNGNVLSLKVRTLPFVAKIVKLQATFPWVYKFKLQKHM